MKRAAAVGPALCALVLLALPAAEPPADDDKLADEKTLRDAGFGADAPAVLDFFRKRTLTEEDRKQFAALIRQLGADDFDKRERASNELRSRGAPVLPLLRAAQQSDDREVARRAEMLIQEIETTGPSLPIAAARLLARHKPPEAVEVLLAYLPHADDDSVEEEVLNSLLALTPEKGKVGETLAAALKDDQPARRGAAGYVLGRKGTAEQTRAVRGLLVDKSAKVRFRTAQGLLAAHDKEAVPALVQLLEDGTPEMAWQVEDVLVALAGEKAPAVSIGDGGAADRRKCREEWSKWWKANGDAADLAVLDDRERLAGLTLGIEVNPSRLFECGPDKKIRWEIKTARGPMDAQVLPGGRVLFAEMDSHLVKECDFQGNVKWEKKIGDSPTGCQRLPNGNTFVSTYTSVMEFDRAGKEVFNFRIPGSNAIRKHRNGNIVYTTAEAIVEVTTENREVRKVPLPKDSMWVGIQDLPGDRFMVANSSTGRVVEVDKGGKILWEGQVAGACGVWRVPNGHTLVAAPQRIVELDRAGKIVWEVAGEGYMRRVHRR
jgi:hypothetical protein